MRTRPRATSATPAAWLRRESIASASRGTPGAILAGVGRLFSGAVQDSFARCILAKNACAAGRELRSDNPD